MHLVLPILGLAALGGAVALFASKQPPALYAFAALLGVALLLLGFIPVSTVRVEADASGIRMNWHKKDRGIPANEIRRVVARRSEASNKQGVSVAWSAVVDGGSRPWRLALAASEADLMQFVNALAAAVGKPVATEGFQALQVSAVAPELAQSGPVDPALDAAPLGMSVARSPGAVEVTVAFRRWTRFAQRSAAAGMFVLLAGIVAVAGLMEHNTFGRSVAISGAIFFAVPVVILMAFAASNVMGSRTLTMDRTGLRVGGRGGRVDVAGQTIEEVLVEAGGRVRRLSVQDAGKPVDLRFGWLGKDNLQWLGDFVQRELARQRKPPVQTVTAMPTAPRAPRPVAAAPAAPPPQLRTTCPRCRTVFGYARHPSGLTRVTCPACGNAGNLRAAS